jgi:hypothetical protein
MDRFSKICLISIILLLAVIATRPLIVPQPVRAAQRTYHTVAVTFGENSPVEKALNENAAKAWELVAAYPMTREISSTLGIAGAVFPHGGNTEGVVLVFQK